MTDVEAYAGAVERAAKSAGDDAPLLVSVAAALRAGQSRWAHFYYDNSRDDTLHMVEHYARQEAEQTSRDDATLGQISVRPVLVIELPERQNSQRATAMVSPGQRV